MIVEEYAATGDAKNESSALRVLLESVEDPDRRKELFLRLADVEENKLSAPAAGQTLEALKVQVDRVAQVCP